MRDNKLGLVVLFGFFVVVSVILMFVSFPLGFTVLVIFSGSLGFFLFIYFFLAPKNIFFTFIEEGTAKMIVRGGKFRKALIQWKDYTFDTDDTVIFLKDLKPPKAEKYHPFGGLRFYGLWPLDQIYTYKFEWTGLESDGITPRPHTPEVLDNVLLKQYVYFSRVEKAEDLQRLPLNVCFVLTIQITNPYKVLFKVHNWLAVTFGRIAPEIRNVIAQKTYEELICSLEGVADQVKENITKNDILEILKNDYGVDVLDIKILTIDPLESFREATLVQFKAEQEKKRIEIEAEAKKTQKIKEGEGDAEAFKKKIDALGGGENGINNFVALEISKNIKDGDKIIIHNLHEISKLFTKSFFGG